MVNNYLTRTDLDFDSLLSKRYQNISKVHWTPIQIIETVVEWCKENSSSSILDIGSGVGKFCMVGASISKLKFTGIEKRKSLYKQAVKIKDKLEVKNVSFFNDNILNIDFSDFDTFYYFNPFFEQIHELERIDKTTNYQPHKFLIYQEYVFNELSKKEKGTKFISYCSQEFYPPDSYAMRNMKFDGLLQMWEKEV